MKPLILFFVSTILYACSHYPPPKLQAPKAKDWIIFEQGGDFSFAATASSTYTNSNGTVQTTTVTATGYSQEIKLGTFLKSSELSKCQGYTKIGDCNSLFKKANQ